MPDAGKYAGVGCVAAVGDELHRRLSNGLEALMAKACLDPLEAAEDLRPGLLVDHGPDDELLGVELHEGGPVLCCHWEVLVHCHRGRLAMEEELHNVHREAGLTLRLVPQVHLLKSPWLEVSNRRHSCEKVARSESSLVNVVKLGTTRTEDVIASSASVALPRAALWSTIAASSGMVGGASHLHRHHTSIHAAEVVPVALPLQSSLA
mmetsp:Transcript_35355/g.82632  ORF Transcript_35355/g.82632 Transcript_35355/m.82632 type:complete len:207 (-) Transcript_35355:583-1203(-)